MSVAQLRTEHVPGHTHARAHAAMRVAPTIALGVVLATQLVVLVTLVNGPFQDEALYVFAGRDLWHAFLTGARPTDQYGTYFSGLPEFYPVVAGWLDHLGGLEAVRALSMACVMWLTCVVFIVARRLFGSRAAVIAAAAFALEPSVLYIGRLATYDAFSLALVGTALALAAGRPAWWRSSLIVWALAAAAVAKYATGAFVPGAIVICTVLLLQRARPIAVVRQVIPAVLAATAVAVTVLGVLRIDPTAVSGLTTTTADRNIIDRVSAPTILLHAVPLLGLFAALAMCGLAVVLVRHRSRGEVVAGIVLAGSVFIAPAYHALTGEMTSFDKHIGFGMLFGAPLVGVALDRLRRPLMLSTTAATLVTSAALMVLAVVGVQQAHSLYSSWPNPAPLTETLRTIVRPSVTRVLAEEDEVPRYTLDDESSGWQYTGLDYFRYTPGAGASTQGSLVGLPAYESAIGHRYFGAIVLREHSDDPLSTALARDVRGDHAYVRVASIPFTTSYGDDAYEVWALR
jgi:hypothetical protein